MGGRPVHAQVVSCRSGSRMSLAARVTGTSPQERWRRPASQAALASVRNRPVPGRRMRIACSLPFLVCSLRPGRVKWRRPLRMIPPVNSAGRAGGIWGDRPSRSGTGSHGQPAANCARLRAGWRMHRVKGRKSPESGDNPLSRPTWALLAATATKRATKTMQRRRGHIPAAADARPPQRLARNRVRPCLGRSGCLSRTSGTVGNTAPGIGTRSLRLGDAPSPRRGGNS